jgi:hypothetical protein
MEVIPDERAMEPRGFADAKGCFSAPFVSRLFPASVAL